MSAAHASPVLSPLDIYGLLAAALNKSFQFYCFWHYLLIGNLFVQRQKHLYIRIILHCNSGAMATDFEQVIVSIHLFSWILCTYAILD